MTRTEQAHIAINTHYMSAELAERYNEALHAATGRDVFWTFDPYARPFEPVGRVDDAYFGPEAISRRLEIIRTAAALVVVTTLEEEWPPEHHQQRGGVLFPTGQQQADILVARGADVPVYMPEGLPTFRPRHQDPGLLDGSLHLMALGVQAPEGDMPFSERVGFVRTAVDALPGAVK